RAPASSSHGWRFGAAAEAALRAGDPDGCLRVAATCAGELLPDASYEAWTQDARRRSHALLVALLRRGGDLERLLVIAPDHRDGLRLRAEVLDALGDER